MIEEALRELPGGYLLDVGCGPGIMVRRLLDTRPGCFRIVALDRWQAMVDVTRAQAGGLAHVVTARAEDLPFADGTFDVVIAMGVIEYTPANAAVREIGRVTKPGGEALITMLNPLSPYRLFEWFVWWLLRICGRLERLLGRPPERRHTAPRSGIRALPAPVLRRMMFRAGLQVDKVVYHDRTALVPPLDRIARRWDRSWRDHPERTVARGYRRFLGVGTAYLTIGRRVKPLRPCTPSR